MRRAVLSAVALGLTVALAAPGSAVGAKPQIEDAKGDSLPPSAGMDIVSVTFDTTGKKVGKKYTPDTVVVTMELAGTPASSNVAYDAYSTASGCGTFQFSYTPGAFVGDGSVFLGCGSPPDETGSTATLIENTPKVDGKKIIWSIKLKALPKEIKVGTSVSEFSADTQYVEPLTGIIGTAIVPLDIVDYAESAKTWKIG